jgi:hypothetical protein
MRDKAGGEPRGSSGQWITHVASINIDKAINETITDDKDTKTYKADELVMKFQKFQGKNAEYAMQDT